MTSSDIGDPLPAGFFERPAAEVAPDLLGRLIVSTLGEGRTVGRIVETEAYLGARDPASHAAERIGRTPRNAAMFGRPGTAYVYLSYGIHWCMNAVTDRVDLAGAVLIRALEPVDGLDLMRERRGTRDLDLARGPGRLTQALGITVALDGHSLQDPPLTFHPGEPVAADDIEAGPRVGITRAAEWPLRFMVRESPWVSGPRRRRLAGDGRVG